MALRLKNRIRRSARKGAGKKRLPSTNGDDGSVLPKPLANGDNGPPSTNGDNGAPLANGDNGRDTQGRFTKGNQGGPGNPFARQVAAFRKAICQAVTDDDIRLLAQKLLEQAKQGDLASTKLLWLYTVGKPSHAVDPDTLDLQEWNIFQRTPADPGQVNAILRSMPVDLACTILRAAMPSLVEALQEGLAQKLERGWERRRLKREKAAATA
jgi:hypothetical protein